jgi:hypothetical protein
MDTASDDTDPTTDELTARLTPDRHEESRDVESRLLTDDRVLQPQTFDIAIAGDLGDLQVQRRLNLLGASGGSPYSPRAAARTYLDGWSSHGPEAHLSTWQRR